MSRVTDAPAFMRMMDRMLRAYAKRLEQEDPETVVEAVEQLRNQTQVIHAAAVY
jgi:hypothetical protein